MSMPSDNSFVRDSNAVRLARLQSIQSNRALFQTWLGALPPDLATWASDCYTEYSSIADTALAENFGAQSATVLLRQKRTALRKELLFAKQYIQSFYDADDVERKAFGIESEMPTKPDALRALAVVVLQLHAEHLTANLPYRMPDALVLRIQAAHDDLENATDTHGKENAEKRKAVAAEQQRFDLDTRMLRKLLALWNAAMGDSDERIAYLGMVNTQPGGNSGRPGVPTLQVENNPLRLLLQADSSRPPATSYQVQFRDINELAEWVELHSGSETLIPLTDPHFGTGNGGVEIRARARNANGYSEWSAVFGGL